MWCPFFSHDEVFLRELCHPYRHSHAGVRVYWLSCWLSWCRWSSSHFPSFANHGPHTTRAMEAPLHDIPFVLSRERSPLVMNLIRFSWRIPGNQFPMWRLTVGGSPPFAHPSSGKWSCMSRPRRPYLGNDEAAIPRCLRSNLSTFYSSDPTIQG